MADRAKSLLCKPADGLFPYLLYQWKERENITDCPLTYAHLLRFLHAHTHANTLIKSSIYLGVAVHACNPSTWMMVAG